jgi:hypothetical protein
MSINAKDLTKQAPTSPRHRTGGYGILLVNDNYSSPLTTIKIPHL